MSKERGLIIAFAGQKGGSGKSTIAENVAVGMKKNGADTVIIDCDIDQRTSSKWISRRNDLIEEDKTIEAIHSIVQSDNIKQCVIDAATRYDVVIMDVAGRDGRALRTALLVADIIYIPIRPSQNDLETLDHVAKLLEETFDMNPNRVVRTLLTMCPTHSQVTEKRDAADFLGDFKKMMELSDSYVAERKVYRDASLKGTGVLEENNEKASFEINKLIKEIMTYV